MNRYLLVVTPGIERLLQEEVATIVPRLSSLGKNDRFIRGGIELQLSNKEASAIAYQSRLLESIRLRLQSCFITEWYQLENFVNHLPFPEKILSNSCYSPILSISSHHSKLYHTKAIEQRILETRQIKALSQNPSTPLPLFFRFDHNYCTASIEIGGNYKRGYRTHVCQAPLRETIAAAIAFSTFHSAVPSTLIDPFCGSGTLLQETWSFATADWPTLQRTRLLSDHFDLSNVLYNPPPNPENPWEKWRGVHYIGNDINNKCIEATQANFSSLSADIHLDLVNFSFSDFRAQMKDTHATVISNPPYGYKAKAVDKSILKLYQELFEWIVLLREERSLHAASFLLPRYIYDDHLPGAIKKEMRRVFQTRNGGLPVTLVSL